jgi:hypothetical protein
MNNLESTGTAGMKPFSHLDHENESVTKRTGSCGSSVLGRVWHRLRMVRLEGLEFFQAPAQGLSTVFTQIPDIEQPQRIETRGPSMQSYGEACWGLSRIGNLSAYWRDATGTTGTGSSGSLLALVPWLRLLAVVLLDSTMLTPSG